MSHPFQSQSAAMFRSHTSPVTAPLAIPEPIEIADYSSVKVKVILKYFTESFFQALTHTFLSIK